MSWSWWDKKDRESKQDVWRWIEIGCYSFILILGCVVIASFLWERPWPFGENGYMADAEVLGGFGDFLAGSVGTAVALVSMYLLFRTLRSQVAATHTNSVQMENQRFNELFFHLLSLYREAMHELSCQRTSLSFSEPVSAQYEHGVDYSGVHFFELWRRMKVLTVPTNRGFLAIRSEVLRNYQWFYAEHRNSLGAYYRIVYRILDLIETSEILEEEKVRYSKILRAQLSESELLMMYYNSLSDGRRKLGRYIWQYNILKHLPALEIRELSGYASGLNQREQMELDRLYRIVMKIFKIGLDDNSNSSCGNYLWLWALVSLVPDSKDDADEGIIVIRVTELDGVKKSYSGDYPGLTSWNREKWKDWLADAATAIDFMGAERLRIEIN